MSDARTSDVWLVVGLGNPGPALRRPPAQRRLPRRRRAGRADGLAASGRTSPAAPTWSRAGSAPRRPGRASCWPAAALLHERVRRPGQGARDVLQGRRPSGSSRSTTSSTSPFGTLRIKLGGGDNGHNGLRRCGPRSAPATSTGSAPASAARPAARTSPTSCCPTTPPPSARSCRSRSSDAADAVESLITDGLEKTQQRFNS